MTKLVDGRIPPLTECPYKAECPMAGTSCHHKGTEHKVAFSCGAARAFELIHKYENTNPEIN
jgi:hypothetical protein